MPTSKIASPTNVSFSPFDATSTTQCPGVCPPVTRADTPAATSTVWPNCTMLSLYSSTNFAAALRSAGGTASGIPVLLQSGFFSNSTSAAAQVGSESLRERMVEYGCIKGEDG